MGAIPSSSVRKEGNSQDAIRSGSGIVERSEDGRYLGVGSSSSPLVVRGESQPER